MVQDLEGRAAGAAVAVLRALRLDLPPVSIELPRLLGAEEGPVRAISPSMGTRSAASSAIRLRASAASPAFPSASSHRWPAARASAQQDGAAIIRRTTSAISFLSTVNSSLPKKTPRRSVGAAPGPQDGRLRIP